MHAQVWVIKHNWCGVVSLNVGWLIAQGKWEIDVISSHDGLGSDWNGHGICGLDVNGIARGNGGGGGWHVGGRGAVSECTHWGVCVWGAMSLLGGVMAGSNSARTGNRGMMGMSSMYLAGPQSTKVGTGLGDSSMLVAQSNAADW